MPGAAGGLSDNGWIEVGPKPAKRPSGLLVRGEFRIVVPEFRGRKAQDTGWIPNEITYLGVWSVLARFAHDPTDFATDFATFETGAGSDDSLTPALIADSPLCIGVGIGSSVNYFGDDTLGSEVTYVTERPLVNSWVLAGPNSAQAKTLARKVILSASYAANTIAGVGGTVVDLTEVGIFNDVTPGGVHMYAATTFTPAVSVAVEQPFTAFYSVSLSQAA